MLDDLLDWFFVDLLRTPRRRKIAAYVISYAATAVLLAIFALAVNWFAAPQVHAAAEPVPQCAKIAETPNLSIYLCEPDNAPPFLINSYGFMVMVE